MMMALTFYCATVVTKMRAVESPINMAKCITIKQATGKNVLAVTQPQR